MNIVLQSDSVSEYLVKFRMVCFPFKDKKKLKMKKTISKTDSRQVLKTIKSHLECKICFDNMIGYVWQCSNGHVICATCQKKCQVCPYCKERITSRNLVLEEILSDYIVQCPFLGCKHKCKNKSMLFHKKRCVFAPQPCKYCPSLLQPTNDAFINHMKDEHKGTCHVIEEGQKYQCLYTFVDADLQSNLQWGIKCFLVKDILYALEVRTHKNDIVLSIYAIYETKHKCNLQISGSEWQSSITFDTVPLQKSWNGIDQLVSRKQNVVKNGNKCEFRVIITFGAK